MLWTSTLASQLTLQHVQRGMRAAGGGRGEGERGVLESVGVGVDVLSWLADGGK